MKQHDLSRKGGRVPAIPGGAKLEEIMAKMEADLGKPLRSARNQGTALHTGTRKPAVYLLLDCSSSMEGVKLSQAKSGAVGFAEEACGKGYGVGLIAFSPGSTTLRIPRLTRQRWRRRSVGYERMARRI